MSRHNIALRYKRTGFRRSVTALTASLLLVQCSRDAESSSAHVPDGAVGTGVDSGLQSIDAARPPILGQMDAMTVGEPDATATDESDSGAPLVTMCDGSSNLRFRYQVIVALRSGDAGRDICWENDLVIDGTCRFWILSDAWKDAHTGVLESAEAAEFQAEIEYRSWSRLAGSYSPSGGAGYDVAPVVLSDGSTQIVCTGRCDSPGGEVWAIFESVRRWEDRLYSKGSATSGAMRLTALISHGSWPDDEQPIRWPLERAVDEFVFDPTSDQGRNPGVVVDDESSLQLLRRLRKQRAGNARWQQLYYIPVDSLSPSDTRYELYFSDTTQACSRARGTLELDRHATNRVGASLCVSVRPLA